MDRKHERCSKIFAVTPIAIILCLFFLSAQDTKEGVITQFDERIKEKSIAIDSIKSELERGRRKVKELEKKEGAYLEQLQALEKNIEVSNAYLGKITEKAADLTKHIEILKDSLVIISDALAKRQKKMRKRLRDIYKTGRPDLIEIILTSGNISEMLTRIKYFQELNRYDKMLILSIDSTRAVVEDNKRRLEDEQVQLTELKSSKEAEKEVLVVERKKRESVLSEVTSEKEAYVAMVKELEQAQQELNLLVQRLEKKRKIAEEELRKGLKVAFEKRKGTLPWPVEGKVIREYGKIVHPVYKTTTMSNGVDIKVRKGETVTCVASGRVDYIGWMRGYGKFVIVNHFGGYLSIYAHLDKVTVAEDQEIKYGQEVGLAGETGSLNGPKLHFQIRQSSETQNPREWLEKRE